MGKSPGSLKKIRVSLRTILYLFAIIGMGIGWKVDRERIKSESEWTLILETDEAGFGLDCRSLLTLFDIDVRTDKPVVLLESENRSGGPSQSWRYYLSVREADHSRAFEIIMETYAKSVAEYGTLRRPSR